MIWQTLGFDLNKTFFENGLRGDDLSHAYLFTGQEMIGKKTFALDVAGLRLDCNLGSVQNNPNFLFIDGDESITIGQIRDFKKFFSLKPYSGRYKIGVINNCHLMTGEAANSILKILEEPPRYSLIILVTANPGQLLPTIRSRCEELKFSPHPKSRFLKALAGLGLNQAQAEFLMEFSNGRLGLAYSLKQNDSFRDIKKMLEKFNQLLKADINERLNFAEKIFKSDESESLNLMMLNWMFYLRSGLSEKLKINRARILKKMIETQYILSKPQFNHRLAFENFLISL